MLNVKIDQIVVREPFCSLYPIDQNVLEAIQKRMSAEGFDEAFPLIAIEEDGNYTVIDGHSRLKAAQACGINTVPVSVMNFDSDMDALEYAIRCQRDRRNLSKLELQQFQVRAIELLDKRKTAGRPKKELGPAGPNSFERSAERTADLVGTSPRSVKRVRAVLDSNIEDVIEGLKSGELSVNAASERVLEKKKLEGEDKPKSKPVFNPTNYNIEWAKWSWNPVTGCKYGCKYCYAKHMLNRFNPQGFEPTFHPERLSAPANTRPKEGVGGNVVFVCSVADLFGPWVPNGWIFPVIDECVKNPQWTFLFLTKNSERLKNLSFPDNCWLGATVDTQERADEVQKNMPEISAVVKFISCEPLLEPVHFNDLSFVNWVIIGGQSETIQVKAFQPEFKWVLDLTNTAYKNGVPVYWKPNLTVRPKEYPVIKQEEESV